MILNPGDSAPILAGNPLLIRNSSIRRRPNPRAPKDGRLAFTPHQQPIHQAVARRGEDFELGGSTPWLEINQGIE